MPRIVFCHGFASSPVGRKVTALRAAIEPLGFTVAAPDLNAPSFERLDWDAMVARTVSAVTDAPTDVLVGSSLGGLVALAASRDSSSPAPLVLVTPTMGFGRRWTPPLPDGAPLRFVDPATGDQRFLHRAFVDAFLAGPESLPPPAVPVTVIAGRRDETIPFERIETTFDQWCASGALVVGSELIGLPDADHTMVGFDDVILDALLRRAGATPRS